MTTVTKRELTGTARCSTSSTCWIVILSQYSQDVVLTVGNQTVTIGLTVMGADAPAALSVDQAGYYAQYNITNLSGFTEYSYTLTQSGTASGTLAFNGKFMTSPGASDDFAVILGSCAGGDSVAGVGYIGAYSAVKAYKDLNTQVNPDQLPLVALIGVDDMPGYLDSYTLDDSAGSGHKVYSAPASEAEAYTEYDACVRIMINAGMVDTDIGTRVSDSKEKTRIYCHDNINSVHVAGDHPFFNDVGFGADNGTARLNGVTASAWQTTVLFTHKETAWNILCGAANGTAFDITSSGFSIELGSFQFLGLDRNYGDGSNRESGGAYLFSQAQVDGFTSALAGSSAAFRVVGCAAGYHTDAVTDIFTLDTNNAAKDGTGVSEIFTNNVDSLMAKHVADGSKWFMFQGDIHTVRITEHARAAGGAELAEQFLVFNVANMSQPNNGAANLASDAALSPSEPSKGWYDWGAADYLTGTGVNAEWRRFWDYGDIPGYPDTTTKIESRKLGHCLFVEVFGSESPKRMKIRIVTNELLTDYSCEYLIDGGTNLPTINQEMRTR